MKGFSKNPIGRDIEYILDANPRVTVIRGCYCKYNCGSTWLTQLDRETITGGYNNYFKQALIDAHDVAEKLANGQDLIR